MADDDTIEGRLKNLSHQAMDEEQTRTKYVSRDNLESALSNVEGHKVLKQGRYTIDFDIIIPDSATLEIEPGTRLNLVNNSRIMCQGTLRAIGHPSDMITFTSEDKKMHSIVIDGSGANASHIESCRIEHATGSFWGTTLQKSESEEIRAGYGALVILKASPTIRDNEIINNGCTGILLYKSHSDITNNTISFNAGRGIYVGSCAGEYVQNTIEGNYPPMQGGGMEIRDSIITLMDNTIQRNVADRGAGVIIHGGKPIIEDNVIRENSAEGAHAGFGGGIAVYNHAVPTIKGNDISNNRAMKGGGIFTVESGGVIQRNSIAQNHANSGGGVYFEKYMDSSNIATSVISNRIIENTTDESGAGLFVANLNPEIVDNDFIDNRSFRGDTVIDLLITDTPRCVRNRISYTPSRIFGTSSSDNHEFLMENNTIG